MSDRRAGSFLRRVFGRKRQRPPWDDPKVLRSMVCDLYLFVQSELESTPHPMEAYFIDRTQQQTAAVLSRWLATERREDWVDAFK